MLCVSKLRPRVASTTEEDWNATCLEKTMCIAHMLVKHVLWQLRHFGSEKYLITAFQEGTNCGHVQETGFSRDTLEADFTHISVVATLKHIW